RVRASRGPTCALRARAQDSREIRKETSRTLSMPTINQLINHGRLAARVKTASPALKSCPQKRGVCVRVYTTTPKKPNADVRKVSRARLNNAIEHTSYTHAKR